MKILMSAFSCCPNQGSEPGVGWNWAVEAARQGHRVRVLTQICDREAIEAAIAAGEVPEGLTFDFFMPDWLQRLKDMGLRTGREGLTLQIVHLLWQFVAYTHARKHYGADDFDIVHHITFAGIRHPTRMGGLPYPLILGPLGGGERAPFNLRQVYPWSGWFSDLARDIHTWSLRLDPITRRAVSQALLVYAKTTESRDALPGNPREPIRLHIEIGIPDGSTPQRSLRDPNAPFRLLFAGRFLHWKGMAIGLRAIAAARAKGIDAQLTMVGAGPQDTAWRELANQLGLDEYVDWRGWLPHDDFQRLYPEHDAMLFPSLHDSSGNVVLEAFANAMPVICLDVGGPGYIVDETCGRAVPVQGRALSDCIEGLADTIAEIARSSDLHQKLSRGAAARVDDLRWPKVVGGFYDEVESALAAKIANQSRDTRHDFAEGHVRQLERDAL